MPPCASTIFLEMNNPNPVPSKDFAENLENNLSSISWVYAAPSIFDTNNHLIESINDYIY